MRPIKLVLCGWGPYRDKVTIDFEAFEGQGLFLITGPTGAGKTTLFDAMTYALYGALSGEMRDKERGSVRSDFATEDTPTYVELVMEHGGQKYEIVRNPKYLRPKKRGKGSGGFVEEKENAVLKCADGTVIEGVKEVNEKLLNVLALDYSQFKQISMIAQGEFARLLTAPPKDKTRIFREIFGTGVYDRFTLSLGNRARKLYAQVMEQKHKLEEDIRVLTVGLEASGFSQERKEQLMTLTQATYWNYAEVRSCMEAMEEEAWEEERKAKQAYEEAEKAVEHLTKRLTKWKEENRRVEQFQKVSKEREIFLGLSKEYAEKERLLIKAVNAGLAEVAQAKAQQSAQAVLKNREEQKILIAEREALTQEKRMLASAADRREQIEAALKVMAELESNISEQKQMEYNRKDREESFLEGQKLYLEKEKRSICCQRKYEEGDRQQKLSAIGLAVSMLEEGEPCPVCGSVNHPAPAKVMEASVTKEELDVLKKQWDMALEDARKHHEKVIERKTQLKMLDENLDSLAKLIKEKEQILRKQRSKVVQEYLSMPSSFQAQNRFQKEMVRFHEIQTLLEEKERQLATLKAAEALGSQQEKDDALLFREALTQYGFRSKVEYERSKMTRQDRESLDKDIREFHRKEAANRELYEHLKASVKSTTVRDLATSEEELDRLRQLRKSALEGQKNWNRHLIEVRKTKQLMQSRQELMEEKEKEYGYVKDLENMACGNNSKKLVFEQYVLAGYFEEILRAANLRFRKMTSGRYEMSRVGQVGDGRVKDNLEIQVMDFYTGKFRSVRTLSGGESFKASLALALGMSDVIQAMSGGIRVDTLFIDEGFGALDSESLDQACETLMSLVEKNRLIGIISHVPELSERIDRQLVVERTPAGSTVKVVH